MATRQLLVDDLDGSTEGIRTVHFSLDGRDYAIDLSAEHQQELRTALAPYLKVSRNGSNNGRVHRRPSSTVAVSDIRAWANANGYNVGVRGRIPSTVRAAFEKSLIV